MKKRKKMQPSQAFNFVHLDGAKEKPIVATKKSKKPRKPRDSAYSSRQSGRRKSTSANTSVLHLRADTSKTVVLNGEEVPKKTATVLCVTPLRLKGVDRMELMRKFDASKADIETDRPIQMFTRHSVTGTPLQAQTPGGSLLQLTSKNGFMLGFSNRPDVTLTPPVMAVSDAFEEKSATRRVKKNPHAIKHVRVTITPDLLKQVDAELARNNGVRSRSQNAVMTEEGEAVKKVSATRYAGAAELLSDELKWEWLHLIAHQILGSTSQNENNLGCGSFHANTDMIMAEMLLRPLVDVYPEGFLLDVKAHFVPGTQLLGKIEYSIITPNFTLPFVFNAQLKNKPDIYNAAYVSALVGTLNEMSGGVVETDEQLPKRRRINFQGLSVTREPIQTEVAVSSSLIGLFAKRESVSDGAVESVSDEKTAQNKPGK